MVAGVAPEERCVNASERQWSRGIVGERWSRNGPENVLNMRLRGSLWTSVSKAIYVIDRVVVSREFVFFRRIVHS